MRPAKKRRCEPRTGPFSQWRQHENPCRGQWPGIERCIGAIRWECLSKFIIFGKQHLDHLRSEVTAYYNEARTHSERDHLPSICALPANVEALTLDEVEVKTYVSGLVKLFERKAA